MDCTATCIYAMLLCPGWFHLSHGSCWCVYGLLHACKVLTLEVTCTDHRHSEMNYLLNNIDGALLHCLPYRRFKMKNTSTMTTYAYYII